MYIKKNVYIILSIIEKTCIMQYTIYLEWTIFFVSCCLFYTYVKYYIHIFLYTNHFIHKKNVYIILPILEKTYNAIQNVQKISFITCCFVIDMLATIYTFILYIELHMHKKSSSDKEYCLYILCSIICFF